MPIDATIHIIDDDEAIRESLSFLLDTAGLKSRVYETPTEFLAALPVEEPACVVTDIRMPEMSGIDLLKKLREANDSLPVIVITGHGDVTLAVEAMKLGAADFLEKPFADDALLDAIRVAVARAASADRIGHERAAAAERLATLSARERDVLGGLVAGKPNKTIAYDFGISPRTVEVYRANLMTKMHASSLSELVRMALLAEGFSG
ncbi:MAG: response regulator FixJ [Propylenella sp.]